MGECGQDSCLSSKLELSFMEAGTSVIRYCSVKGLCPGKECYMNIKEEQ